MAIVLTDDEFVTLDESLGLQDSGVGEANEDNNDEDISLASLNAAFSSRLFDAGGLALDDSFAAANGVAANDFISLTEGSTLTGFVKANGDPLLAFEVGVTDPTTGVLAGFTTVDGEAIYLFADVATGGGLGAFMFLGVDASGDIVLAGHLQADGTISTVQFEAISNPDSADHDDPVDLTGLLDVAASGSIDFDFNTLPSGNNLFGMLGASPTDPAIIIFGKNTDIDPDDGTKTNDNDDIFTSQGGIDATIGVGNQMFDPGEGAYFVYVNDPEASFLSGYPDGLDATEADDADNILYNGGTLDVLGAKLQISQIQGGGLAALSLTTYLGDADQARDLLADPASGPSPDIIAIRVYDVNGVKLEDTDDLGGFDDPDIEVTGLGTATVTVEGLDAGYFVEWVTDGLHNRVLVEGVEGKFDIGGFTITQGVTTHEPVGDRIVFEDDGPTVGDGEGTAALTVDDSDFTTDDFASYAGLFDVDFGTDGGKDSDNDGTVDVDAVTYALGVTGGPDAVSGLTDTLTGEAVVLNLDGTVVVGTTALGGLEVFRVSVDVNTGEVTLDQSRAVVHDDPEDPEEDGVGEPSKLTSADLITLTATATDDDGDTDDHTVNIGDTFNFLDDGPSVELADASVPSLTTDDTDITDTDTADFSVLFDVVFGNDGEADTDAIVYALSIGGGSDIDSGLVDTLSGQAVLLNLDVGGDVVGTTALDGDEVLRISVDADGMVTLTQSRSVVHDNPDDSSEDTEPSMFSAANLVSLLATAYDGDGDHDDASVDIGLAFNFEDDGPSIDTTGAEVPSLITDDTDIIDSDTADFSGQFTALFGQDGEAAIDSIIYELGVGGLGSDVDSGLVDTLSAEAVLLNKVGDDIVGTTAIGGLEVLRISVDADGMVTLEQSRAVVHDDPLDPDEAASPAMFSAADLVSLTATAYDGDGDHDEASVDIGLAFKFLDDGPAIGPIADDVVDFVNGDSASNLLGADTGNDGGGVSITDFTPSFDFDFATVIGVQTDDKTVVYYEDEDGTGVIEADETNAYFQLSLNDSDADPANWDYVFDVLQDPNVVNIAFDFDELPSGANLFGVVGESADDPAIIVFGKNPVLKADGTYSNKSDVIHTSQGGTGATIGVNNQMFDPKEGAYFVYVDNPDPNYLSGVPGGLTQTEADDADNVLYTGGTVDVHTASLSISQMQGNKLAQMKLTTWLGDADTGRDLVLDPTTGTSPDIIMVRVTTNTGTTYEFDADSDPAVNGIDVSGLGTQTVTVIGLNAGYTVEWTTDDLHNRVLVENVQGKFDIGKFTVAESGIVPDAELNFEVTIEDFDGDTAVSDFTIGIDGDLDGSVTV